MKRRYIITLTSGLGNQMYQYALFNYLKSKNYRVKLFLYRKFLKEHNGFELIRVFKNIQIWNTTNCVLSFFVFIHYYFNYLFSFFKRFGFSRIFTKISISTFYSVILFPEWDTYTFNKEFISELQSKLFLFPPVSGLPNTEILTKILSCDSVSIHIRRGDYIDNARYRRTHGDVCDKNYYLEAINVISKSIDKPIFFVFSDDIEWARNNLELKNVYFIDWNRNENSFMDMVLMSNCRHNIIANSTFSMWGAILNKHKHKIVVAPYKWLNDINDLTPRKLLFPEWIIIRNTTASVCLVVNFVISELYVRFILNQTHNDFELIIQQGSCHIHDSRIFCGDSSISRQHKLLFNIDEKEVKNFSDRRYLERKIVHYYETLKMQL